MLAHRCQALVPDRHIAKSSPRGRRWSLARVRGLYQVPNESSMFGSWKVGNFAADGWRLDN